MRSLPFINRFTIELPANVTSSNSICFGDFDNDGDYELCIGASTGPLYIFKGMSTEPWAKLDVYDVVATACGDVFNVGQNCLVVVTADGYLKVFDWTKQKVVSEDDEQELGLNESACGEEEQEEEQQQGEEEEEKALVEENEGGKEEEVVPEDVEEEEQGEEEQEEEQENEEEADTSMSSSSNNALQFACFQQRIPPNVKRVDLCDINGDGHNEVILTLTDRVLRSYVWRGACSLSEGQVVGELMALSKWEFADQVGSFAMCQREAKLHLMVTQCDGILIKDSTSDEHFRVTDILEPVVHDAPPEIVTDLKFSGKTIANTLVVAYSDGVISHLRDDVEIWKLEFEGSHLFGLTKFDVNNDGSEEVLASTWNGQTFVIDVKEGKASVFHFGEEICGFSCGLFTVNEKTLPALVYATFSGLVHVYYNVCEERQVRRGLPTLNGVSPETIANLLYKNRRN